MRIGDVSCLTPALEVFDIWAAKRHLLAMAEPSIGGAFQAGVILWRAAVMANLVFIFNSIAQY